METTTSDTFLTTILLSTTDLRTTAGQVGTTIPTSQQGMSAITPNVPSPPGNVIPTLSTTSNVVGAIIFVLLLVVVLLGLALFLVICYVRRRLKRGGQGGIVHVNQGTRSEIKLNGNTSYIVSAPAADNQYSTNDPLYSLPRGEGENNTSLHTQKNMEQSSHGYANRMLTERAHIPTANRGDHGDQVYSLPRGEGECGLVHKSRPLKSQEDSSEQESDRVYALPRGEGESHLHLKIKQQDMEEDAHDYAEIEDHYY